MGIIPVDGGSGNKEGTIGPNVDCFGYWKTCEADCTQIYKLVTKKRGSGSSCAASDGQIQDCSGGLCGGSVFVKPTDNGGEGSEEPSESASASGSEESESASASGSEESESASASASEESEESVEPEPIETNSGGLQDKWDTEKCEKKKKNKRCGRSKVAENCALTCSGGSSSTPSRPTIIESKPTLTPPSSGVQNIWPTEKCERRKKRC